MKPIILMDMDGPLADFDRAFWDLCEQMGFEMNCTRGQQSQRFATDHVVHFDDRRWIRRHIDTTDWFRHLPVTPGALKGMATLAQLAEVWVVSKPLLLNPRCRDDKAAWLKEHFGLTYHLILANDKSMIRGHVLVDDAPHLDWLADASWWPLIYRTTWNGDGSRWEKLPRWDWNDGVDTLLAFAERCA